jgi:hypothetical protein
MLHNSKAKCWVSEIVYVNVTEQHNKYMSRRICLCECYMISQQIYKSENLFMWMLRDITTNIWVEGIVYVNVTWYHNKYIRVGEIVYVNVT